MLKKNITEKLRDMCPRFIYHIQSNFIMSFFSYFPKSLSCSNLFVLHKWIWKKVCSPENHQDNRTKVFQAWMKCCRNNWSVAGLDIDWKPGQPGTYCANLTEKITFNWEGEYHNVEQVRGRLHSMLSTHINLYRVPKNAFFSVDNI